MVESIVVWFFDFSEILLSWAFFRIFAYQVGGESNGVGAEATRTFTINSDGVSIPAGDGSYNYDSSKDYVAWCWKAGGNKNTFNVDDVGYASASDAGLTAGSITPTGSSVGTRQGFSIIKYTGTDATSNTFSHGLLQKPDFAIFKNLSQSGDEIGRASCRERV